jgi:hypothetical protein
MGCLAAMGKGMRQTSIVGDTNANSWLSSSVDYDQWRIGHFLINSIHQSCHCGRVLNGTHIVLVE